MCTAASAAAANRGLQQPHRRRLPGRRLPGDGDRVCGQVRWFGSCPALHAPCLAALRSTPSTVQWGMHCAQHTCPTKDACFQHGSLMLLLLHRNGVFVTTEARYPYRMNSGVCRFDSIKASVPAQDQFSLRSPGCVCTLGWQPHRHASRAGQLHRPMARMAACLAWHSHWVHAAAATRVARLLVDVFSLFPSADGPSSQSGMQSRSVRQVEPVLNTVCSEPKTAGSLLSHVCAMQQAGCSAARQGARKATGQAALSHKRCTLCHMDSFNALPPARRKSTRPPWQLASWVSRLHSPCAYGWGAAIWQSTLRRRCGLTLPKPQPACACE